MKPRLPISFLALSAISLLAANFWVRTRLANPEIPPAPNGQVMPAVQNGQPEKSSPLPAPERPAVPDKPKLPKIPAFNWAVVESTDYKKYIANLRAIGFPEDTICEIIIADLNKLYSAREDALRTKTVAFDAPVSQRQHPFTAEDAQRVRQLRDLLTEKQRVLKELLGISIPREIIRTPISRNYGAYEYVVSLLPEEKRDAVLRAVEDVFFANDANGALPRAQSLEFYRQLMDNRNAILHQVLTPDEFELFDRNTGPVATELSRRIVGMEPTDAEFTAMLKAARESWEASGGVYGVWHAVPVAREKIAAAEQKLITDFQQILGPDRFLDYQMATTAVGQQLRNLAARYEIPRDAFARAFSLVQEADSIARSAASSATGAAELSARSAELQNQLQQTIGSEAAQAWSIGKGKRPGF